MTLPPGFQLLCDVFPWVKTLYQICRSTATHFIPDHSLSPPNDTIPCILNLTCTAEFDINVVGPIVARAIRKGLQGSIEGPDPDNIVMSVYVWIGLPREPENVAEERITISVLTDVPLDKVPGMSQRLWEQLPFYIMDEDVEFELGGSWMPVALEEDESRLMVRLKWLADKALFDKDEKGPFLFWSNYTLGLNGEDPSVAQGESHRGEWAYKP
ncbi:hypothetical protein BJY04DRAFT_213681 [Aspergillus karnatakaensis]|uniref:uncharacterized protein n=1 Tax=Aspergillus karnatakaensis TaxID=1810916 RepID=UPI003CCE4027